jgi:Tfp pilus assembly protein PilO
MTGTYHAFAQFLAEIGQESRILSVKNVTYNYSPPSKDSDATVSISFVLMAYTFKG